ncbi:MAG: Omp28-related outer membrane protein [Alistipes sp.]|nr:Omp28-related outer membrane protein [Alistipes sp.]
MRKYLYSIVALLATLLATSCLYGKGYGDGLDIEDSSGFKAEVSSTVISANGEDLAVFRAIYNGEDVTTESTLYDAGTNEPFEEMSFSTYTAGVYTFYVTYGEYRSEEIIVTAVQDLDLSDKDESGLSVALSTNLVQMGKNYAALIVRYNGKVLLPAEMKKVKFYDADTDNEVTFEFVAAETAEGAVYALPAFYATEAGTKSFWASYKIANTRNTPVSITAVNSPIPTRPADAEPNNLNFKHRALFTQFTGTWCGYCPNMIAAFHYLFEDATYKDKFVHTSVHNGDQFATKLPDGRDLSNILNTTGSYPYVLANLTTSISTSDADTNISRLMGAIESTMKSEARAGIAARTELKDNTLLVRASVKVSHTSEYYIGAWLVESNLHADQKNYTNIKEDYLNVHENVVRIADSNTTNFMGHPLGNINKGERADHLFIMNLDPSWKVENCHLVLFVSTIQFNNRSMTNAVKTTSLTSGVDFEYRK